MRLVFIAVIFFAAISASYAFGHNYDNLRSWLDSLERNARRLAKKNVDSAQMDKFMQKLHDVDNSPSISNKIILGLESELVTIAKGIKKTKKCSFLGDEFDCIRLFK
ncbi:uncharacterized protein LOC141853851 [Brevipalpus obovatus]|uniref:uncharacterized protein LOC141853851 n=1 Tax=Brevipalpus obovatus TaxID=246614 RepID=UPI003D9F3E41